MRGTGKGMAAALSSSVTGHQMSQYNANMTANARIAGADVKRVAELAHLELNAQEELRLQRDLNAILDYVAQLNELDSTAVAPMAQVAEILSDAETSDLATLRADAPVPSLERASVISAPDSDGVFFKVPKVIER
jgi:aspartyl-tRNA(Asn)/glutamyl-tRNA(Gln) amidotransferase subunit C